MHINNSAVSWLDHYNRISLIYIICFNDVSVGFANNMGLGNI